MQQEPFFAYLIALTRAQQRQTQNGCIDATLHGATNSRRRMSELNSGIKTFIVIGFVSSGLTLSNCMSERGLSLVDYQSIVAAPPPHGRRAELTTCPLGNGKRDSESSSSSARHDLD